MKNPQMFEIKSFDVPNNLKRQNYRLTVDTSDDLKLMKIIYKKFYEEGSNVKLEDVVGFWIAIRIF